MVTFINFQAFHRLTLHNKTTKKDTKFLFNFLTSFSSFLFLSHNLKFFYFSCQVESKSENNNSVLKENSKNESEKQQQQPSDVCDDIEGRYGKIAVKRTFMTPDSMIASNGNTIMIPSALEKTIHLFKRHSYLGEFSFLKFCLYSFLYTRIFCEYFDYLNEVFYANIGESKVNTENVCKIVIANSGSVFWIKILFV